MKDFKKHYIAVIGGSISGSEAANLLANSGFRVVVFDMNKLPYGKIEDGLPSWHINLRNRQEAEIDKKLSHENIRYVPLVKIGRDISFKDLVENWGFSAIILANGAWMDRTVPIDGIDKFKNKGLIYQNDFIYWFNHKHEPNYNGNRYKLKDNAIIFGGGLASLDVVKIFMIELVKEKLEALYNIDEDLFKLEKYGIDSVLEEHDVTFEELNINGVTLVYRRNAEDMPLKSPKDDTQKSIQAAREVSKKLLEKYKEKYKFKFKPLSVPIDYIEENNSLKGILLQKVKLYNGRIVPIENETETLRSDMFVSSIGSIPEQLDGLEYEWSYLKMHKEVDYHVFGYDNVFAVGNAVTGRGNIQESKQHGKQITKKIIDLHLTDDAFEEWLTNLNESIKSKVSEQITSIIDEISSKEVQPDDIIQNILDKTKSLNRLHNYTTYQDWVDRHRPIRLEELIKNSKA
jgi:NADPH-dependent glutamate synthase beta subunit-like oxidoreductase